MDPVAQNQQIEMKIVRRPSRIIVAKKPESSLPAPSAPTNLAISTTFGPALGSSVVLSSSMNTIVTHGPQVFLRVRVGEEEDKAIHYSTTISVYVFVPRSRLYTKTKSKYRSATVYMQDVLELICRKRKMANAKDWALLSNDCKVLVMLDRTVASLEGNSELVLVKRSNLPQYGYPVDGDRRIGKTTDPNGEKSGKLVGCDQVVLMFLLCHSVHFQAYFGSTT
jgi:hypothetical protein